MTALAPHVTTDVAAPVDTDPHPWFGTYSAANFAEVAPERLSIASWSLVGPPQERAMRALAARLWPRSTWHTGSAFVFVGYFGCRPYHNLSALCHMADQVPYLTPAAFTASYFEHAPPPPPLPGLAESRVARLAAVPRLVREVTSLGPRLVELSGHVVELESRIDDALRSGSAIALGAVAADARSCTDLAWEAHMAATALVPALRALQDAAGERATPLWPEIEAWANRPASVPWTWLRDDAAAGCSTGAGAFLGFPFYEIAEHCPPWSAFAPPPPPHDGDGAERAVAALDPADAFWTMPAGSRGLRALTCAVTDAMASRETSKSLAMRVLHALRRLLPAVAAEHGIGDHEWPFLTVDEIFKPADRRALVESRRAGCAAALDRSLPDRLIVDADGNIEAGAVDECRVARGISAGTVTGVVVDPATVSSTRGSEPRILVTDALDAQLQGLVDDVDGVLTTRGSLLSHVAILVRERGIPGVVGHPLAATARPGDHLTIDGSTGEVTHADR